MTEQLHFSLSYIGEGNGNPLQSSCLENPREGGAWWAAVCGVAQSRTRLKRLSSCSSSQKRRSGFFGGWGWGYDKIKSRVGDTDIHFKGLNWNPVD